MAENKKSFIAYSDWHEMFKALPDEMAGKLIKHIFSYVNDENPSTDDFIINALFAQVKSTLKRDLIKWEEQRQQRSEAGKKSAEMRSTKFNERSTSVNETERKSTVSVSVNVSDNVNDIIKEDITQAELANFSPKSFLHQIGVDNNIANDFLKNRKTKRLANTETAFVAILTEINKSGKTANECIKFATEKGWGAFKNSWMLNEINKPNGNKQQTGATDASIIAILDSKFADLPDGIR